MKFFIFTSIFLISLLFKIVETKDDLTRKAKLSREIISKIKDYSEIVESFDKIEESLVSSNEPPCLDDQMASLYHTKISEMQDNNYKNYNYDAMNRLFLNHIYSEEKEIVAFNLLHYRTLSRHDNGFFSTFYLILAFENKIKIYDSSAILIAEKQFDFKIEDVIVFNAQEETNFYLLTDDGRTLRKFKFHIRKFDRREKEMDEIKETKEVNNPYIQSDEFQSLSHISTEGDKITIRTFKENINAYDVILYYKNNLKKFRWALEDSSVHTINKQNEKFEKVIRHVNKGNKILICVLSNGEVIALDEDLNFLKQIKYEDEKNNYINHKFTQVVHNYISFVHFNTPNRIVFHSLENPNKTILICEVINEQSSQKRIKQYIFDTYFQLVFVMMDDQELLIFSPKQNDNPDIKENQCVIVKSIKLEDKLGLEGDDVTLDILRKDLIISNFFSQKVISLDLNEFEEMNEVQDKKISHHLIDLNEYRERYLIEESLDLVSNSNEKKENKNNLYLKNFASCKFIHGHFMLIRKNKNSIFFFELTHPSGKLKGTEEYNFNFKIPIIFIAIAILFIYQYMKNKNSQKEIYEKDKEELMQKLKNFGVFNETTKGNKTAAKIKKQNNFKPKGGEDSLTDEEEEENDDKHFENKMRYLLSQHAKKNQ